MAIEKFWENISPKPFTANGNSEGEVTLSSTIGFRVGQTAIIKATALPALTVVIFRVVSINKLLVYAQGTSNLANLTAYTTAAGATIEVREQPVSAVPDKEHERNVYEEGPVKAKRVIPVDEMGNFFNENNPFPVEATLSDNAPGTPSIIRIAYPTKDVEASYLIPNNTKKIKVSVVDLNAKLRVAYEENGTIDVDDGGSERYATVYLGNSYCKDGVKLVNKTLYYQANKDNLIIEIEAWV